MNGCGEGIDGPPLCPYIIILVWFGFGWGLLIPRKIINTRTI
jgi:hypothetical protein